MTPVRWAGGANGSWLGGQGLGSRYVLPKFRAAGGGLGGLGDAWQDAVYPHGIALHPEVNPESCLTYHHLHPACIFTLADIFLEAPGFVWPG